MTTRTELIQAAKLSSRMGPPHSNRVFAGYENLVDHCGYACNNLDPDLIPVAE